MLKKIIMFHYTPHVICAAGVTVPLLILYSKKLEIDKLQKGVSDDMDRIIKKGRKFSDIPRSN